MTAATARHETRALLRAHLAAASGYRHLTRRCAVCHRLAQYAALGEQPPQAPPPTGRKDRPDRAVPEDADRS